MKTTLIYQIDHLAAGKSIAQYLSDEGYSRRLIVTLRNTPESFFIGDTCVFSNHKLNEGETLTVQLTEKKGSESIVPVPMELSILYEDEHLMVVNKAAGMPVHPSQGNYGNTLANGIAWYMEQHNAEFVFRAVNRLDRDTSGLLLIAKTC